MHVMTQFVKMHGLGNDFVILDARSNADLRVGPSAARAIADRRHGIGCDQILNLHLYNDKLLVSMTIGRYEWLSLRYYSAKDSKYTVL